jgi:hypothetical protein
LTMGSKYSATRSGCSMIQVYFINIGYYGLSTTPLGDKSS